MNAPDARAKAALAPHATGDRTYRDCLVVRDLRAAARRDDLPERLGADLPELSLDDLRSRTIALTISTDKQICAFAKTHGMTLEQAIIEAIEALLRERASIARRVADARRALEQSRTVGGA